MRRRLALLTATTMSLVLVAFLVPLAWLVRSVAEDRALHTATLQAQSLAPVVATTDAATLRLTLEQLNATTGHPFTVFLPDGSVLGAAAPRTPAVELAARGRSLTESTGGGRQVLVSVQRAAGGGAVISTFVPADDLRHGVVRAWLILVGLGVALVALGVAVADRLARTIVGPITEVSTVSHRLAHGDLDARARPAGPPEIRDVASGLNQLAARIRDLLREERESMADLSHRLRTPMTALRLDAESLRDPVEAGRVTGHVDILERTVTQAINEARRSPGATHAVRRCDAVDVVRTRVDFWSVLAEDTDRPVDVDLTTGPLAVQASTSELTAAVDALLGNVFAHTPDGAAFCVLLTGRPGGGARCVVADRGPGFPDGGVRLGQRGASGGHSTGLGLDIARRVAVSSGGTLSLGTTPGGGARVTLDLGPPTRDASEA